jgi:hypothetical protein
MSTGIGTAPTWETASNVAMNVIAGTITPSPGAPQGVEAARDADALGRSAEGREGLLEVLHCRTGAELAALDQIGEGSEDLVLETRVKPGEVDERDLR